MINTMYHLRDRTRMVFLELRRRGVYARMNISRYDIVNAMKSENVSRKRNGKTEYFGYMYANPKVDFFLSDDSLMYEGIFAVYDHAPQTKKMISNVVRSFGGKILRSTSDGLIKIKFFGV